MRSVWRFTANQAIYFTFLIWASLTMLFLLIRVTLPPWYLIPFRGIGDSGTAQEIYHLFGLDQPILDQYINYLIATFTGDLGISGSVMPRHQINSFIPSYIMNTLWLITISLAASILIGILMAKSTMFGGLCRVSRWVNASWRVAAAAPSFVVASFLILAYVPPQLSIHSNHSEEMDEIGAIVQTIQIYALPMICLMLVGISSIYMATKRLESQAMSGSAMMPMKIIRRKGKLVERQKMWVPVAKVSLALPAVTGWIIGSDILIESIFRIRGLGYLLWESIFSLDYFLMSAVVFLFILIALVVFFASRFVLFAYERRVGTEKVYWQDWRHPDDGNSRPSWLPEGLDNDF